MMSLLNLQDSISAAIDRNEYSLGVFIDISKAFDTVNHDILLSKLENIGIRGVALDWFQSYLSNRYQQVLCNGSLSTLRLIKHGVPQGSILGPLLFLLFINDLPNASHLLHFLLFADDTNIFVSHKSYDKLIELMNQELIHVNNWFIANKLSLNVSKTNYILFSSHRKRVPLAKGTVTINNLPIPQVSTTKFLGIYVDQFLTWKDHIAHISAKIAKNIGILSRVAYLLPTSIRLNLYYSIVHPYLNYCNIIWASNYPSRLKRLVILQNRAIRAITSCHYFLSTDSAFKYLCILKIDQITNQQINEFMFRYTTRQLPSAFDNYFTTISESNPYYTRSASNYRTTYSRTNTRRFSLKCMGPKSWNIVPIEIRSSPNIYLFKYKLRNYLINQSSE